MKISVYSEDAVHMFDFIIWNFA